MASTDQPLAVPSRLLTHAERIAHEHLAPHAATVDRDGTIPRAHFDALADGGLYGIVASSQARDFLAVVETLAEACLATAFVWLQHHGLMARLMHPSISSEQVAAWREPLGTGTVRAGIVQAGLLPGDPALTVGQSRGGINPAGVAGMALHGTSPWCTGWGHIDVVLVAARDASDLNVVRWFIVDAVEQPGLRVEPLQLSAAQASNTVRLHFDGLVVAEDRQMGTDGYATVGHANGRGLRGNGSLALGLIRRAVTITGRDRWADALEAARTQLDAAAAMEQAQDPDAVAAMARARAEASLLAMDAGAALMAERGARAAMAGSLAERTVREAAFLLVFGSRHQIRANLLDQLPHR